MLSDWSIIQALRQRTLKLTGHEDASIQPASIDVHLGSAMMRYKSEMDIIHQELKAPVIDPALDVAPLMYVEDIPTYEEGGYELESLGFMLASIREEFEVGDSLAGLLHGLSSVARLGIFVHAQAGLLDPAWKGRATLEIFNAAPFPIKLWRDMPIATVTLHELTTKSAIPYGHPSRNSKYQGDLTVAPSRYHRKLEEKETELKQGRVDGRVSNTSNKGS